MGYCTPVSYVLLFVGGACFLYAFYVSYSVYIIDTDIKILQGPYGPEEYGTSVSFGNEELDLYYPKSGGDCNTVFDQITVKWNCSTMFGLGVRCEGDDESNFAAKVVVTKDCATEVQAVDNEADPNLPEPAPPIEMVLVAKFNAYTVQREGTNGTEDHTVGTYWITSPNQPLHHQWQFAQTLNDALGVFAMILKFVLIAISTCIWWCGACVFLCASGCIWSRSSPPPVETNPGAVEMYQS